MLNKSSKWDKIKQTLTDFNRDEFEKAASTQQPSTPKDSPVPTGRTTLILDSTTRAPVEVTSATKSQPSLKQQTAPLSAQNTAPVSSPPVAEPLQEQQQPVLQSQPLQPENLTQPQPSVEADLAQTPPPPTPPVTIQQAALKVKATTPKTTNTTRGQLNVRLDPALKEIFEKSCNEKGMNMSKVITSMIKTWLGISVLVFTLFAVENSKSYTSADLCTYVLKHAGYGVTSYVPPINTSLSGRQSFFTRGTDLDSFPSGLSNSRLDLRVDIPITPYYSDRSKQKSELQAYIYKHLSSILAASQTLSALDNHVKLLQSRLSYTENQVKLSLANKSQLFTLEDELLKTKSSLYEAQSVLDQRIIELAMACGSDWQEAYQMIKKWDCKLFND